MAVINTTYSTSQTITIGLHSTPLASSPSFSAGRESTQIDNTSDLYVDAIVFGEVTVGTTPTADTSIIVYVWGSDRSLQTAGNEIDALDGTDSDETLANTGILNAAFHVGATIAVLHTTSDVTYHIKPFSVADLFGGVMPPYWGLYVAHNTGTALNSTSTNHRFVYRGIEYTTT